MAKTAPYQLRNTDVRVNSICPGLIQTGMTEATFSYAATRGTSNKIGQLNAMGRYGVPEGTSSHQHAHLVRLRPGIHLCFCRLEIANMALFLASGEAHLYQITLSVTHLV